MESTTLPAVPPSDPSLAPDTSNPPAGTMALNGPESQVYASIYVPPKGGTKVVGFSSTLTGTLYAQLSWAAPSSSASLKIVFLPSDDIAEFAPQEGYPQISFDPVVEGPPRSQSASVVPSAVGDCHFLCVPANAGDVLAIDPIIVITVKPKDPDPT